MVEVLKDGMLTADQDRLYQIVSIHGPSQEHLLQLEFEAPGTEAFAFTFG